MQTLGRWVYPDGEVPLQKVVEEEPLKWLEQDGIKLEELKSKLVSAPTLSLPDLGKPFYLYTNVENGAARGVLAQDQGGEKKPVSFLSKLLDPVTRGWLTCSSSGSCSPLDGRELQADIGGEADCSYTSCGEEYIEPEGQQMGN